MLKTDYKGFGEFMEKIKTAGEEETRTLYKSTLFIPFRFNNRPEVVLVELNTE